MANVGMQAFAVKAYCFCTGVDRADTCFIGYRPIPARLTTATCTRRSSNENDGVVLSRSS